MHRLFKLSSTQLSKLPKLRSSPSISTENYGYGIEKTCSLCKNMNNYSRTFWRSQSTHVNPSKFNKNLKKKRKKKYAELLIVTNSSSSQQRARVTKLTPNDLKLLASTNLNLSELHKLKELGKDGKFVEEHTYHNLAVIENINYVNDDNISDTVCGMFAGADEIESKNVISCILPTDSDTAIGTDSDNIHKVNEDVHLEPHLASEQTEFMAEVESEDVLFESITHDVSGLQPAVLEEHPEVIEGTSNALQLDSVLEEHSEVLDGIEAETSKDKQAKQLLNQEAQEKVEYKTLASYMEICSILNIPQKGFNALYYHCNRCKYGKSYFPVSKVSVYNTLMRGFASKGNLSKLQEVLQLAKSQNVELDVNSYIIIFECLGRCGAIEEGQLQLISTYVKEALKKGITFDKMMNEGYFLNDERYFVLNAFKAYNPDYIPEYYKPRVHYKNHLVNKLNSSIQLEPPEPNKFFKNGGLFTPDNLKQAIKKQLDCEKASYVTVKSIEARPEVTVDTLRFRETLSNHYKLWEEGALGAFQRDLLALTAQKGNKVNYEPYMRCIPAKDFVAIIVDEAKQLAQGSETFSPTVKQLYRDLGKKVYARYLVIRKQKSDVLDKISKVHNKYCEMYAASHPALDVLPSDSDVLNPRQKWQWAEYNCRSTGATLTMDHQEWVPPVLQSIGKFLYHIIMHDLKIDVNSLRHNSKHKNYLPAFYTIFRTQGRMVKEEIKPHPVLSRLYRSAAPETLTFPSYELPMLCPPVPWLSAKQGGYLIAPCEVVRLPYQATAQKELMSQTEPEQLYPSLDALNQLSAVPWKVNQKILDVVLKVFNSGGCSALDIPQPPSSLPPPVPLSSEMDKIEKFQFFRQKLQHRRKKAEMYSLWCDCLYRLSLANHFRKDVFWLPHNMDFRGRVYPVPPHLNHLGSDLARSMLVFAESRPLGPKGLDWLKIHLINLTGLKKRDPVSERLRYANENLDLILDSADKPLDGQRWWAESEEPWQTLACCMEVADALRSGDPENFRSHFPVHQDGSCNGLQHYAALGRDAAGAYSVNLSALEEPQDVYSAVVNLVEEQRQKDADNGIEVAKLLEGFVKRKVIKQTIMTTVYGVTRYGARLQIARQLKDIDDFPKTSVWAASSYLTTKTFESLRTMFTSTREIQDWFTECARLISAVSGQHVEWVTPLGLPIVQPYFKPRKFNYSKVYESFHMDSYEKPNVMKQKNAFPPNFIHSLDSSHMMLTSLYSERAGITFVSVHDCYWTHASTVHIMNQICREQFVSLHSEPILENLSDFLSEKFSCVDSDFADDGSIQDLTKKKLNRILRKVPSTGYFDITEVLDSAYFFS